MSLDIDMVFHGGAVGPSIRQENEETRQIPKYGVISAFSEVVSRLIFI